jgi:hypothetical protein
MILQFLFILDTIKEGQQMLNLKGIHNVFRKPVKVKSLDILVEQTAGKVTTQLTKYSTFIGYDTSFSECIKYEIKYSTRSNDFKKIIFSQPIDYAVKEGCNGVIKRTGSFLTVDDDAQLTYQNTIKNLKDTHPNLEVNVIQKVVEKFNTASSD